MTAHPKALPAGMTAGVSGSPGQWVVGDEPAAQEGGAGMGTLSVQHLDGARFVINVRGHTLTVDQPETDGGQDRAPTPTEMFIGSLASCVGFYALRYLMRHGLPTAGLAVTARYEMGGRPARVTDMRLEVAVPAGVPEERHAALLAVASHCTVHNTLRDPPDVQISVTVAPG